MDSRGISRYQRSATKRSSGIATGVRERNGENDLAAGVAKAAAHDGVQRQLTVLVSRLGLGDKPFLSIASPVLDRLPDLDSDRFFTHGPECRMRPAVIL